ncbi:MAG: L-rhamnose isomerase [Clostridia bacterium]|nr:L-rhamnose isomerase [Clostridia bacterium]
MDYDSDLTAFRRACEEYARLGSDAEAAIAKLMSLPISLHCWQGDDVRGFEGKASLDGGIQTTGNYPGAATGAKELMSDIEFAASLIPGKLRLNLHACYAVPEFGRRSDRDTLRPEDFEDWVEFAKKLGMGIDFNPTFFAHPMVKNGMTLSSPDDEVREFWIRHGICCLRIAEYLAKETGEKCLVNFWMPDGLKDTPADRFSPRARMADSMDRILASGYNRDLVAVSLESKVFGIGVESYTVGSSEFCSSYALSRGLVPLMDNGHYHPTESVADKISSYLLFCDRVALHVTRGVRWDSDHVVRFDDEIREIALEIARAEDPSCFFLALDYFDASINRIAAWVSGARSFRKALLYAFLWPNARGAELQNSAEFTDLFVLSEEIKTAPFAPVWQEYCRRCGVDPGIEWLEPVKQYEKKVTSKR